jgi:hypothetical protein
MMAGNPVEAPIRASTSAHLVPGPIVLLGGFLGGLVWGLDARLWMRFISDDPQFTWAGTLFIVLGFGIAGLGQSGAYLGRRAGLGRPRLTALRVVTFVSLVPLGMAAGGPMFPAVVLAPLAITHTDWTRRMRLAVGAVATIPAVAVAGILFDELSPARAVAGCVWFLVVYGGIIWAARFTLAPQLDGWRAPRVVRLLGIAVLALVALLETLFLVGPKA